MRFRPCIDIHNGSVKQIVGGSLKDQHNQAIDNFVSTQDATYYANMYQKDGLTGGHIILLNPEGTTYYEKDVLQAKKALESYPDSMQIGGGMNAENAELFLEMGASHIIVTSYVFHGGKIDYKRLEKISSQIGKEKLVLDLSCRFVNDDYYIVTDRWQKITDVKMNERTLLELATYCDEFLVHAVDVEGKSAGIEKEVIERLGKIETNPITYAGGIHSMKDIEYIKNVGKNKIDFTVGSSLDLFGGNIPYKDLIKL